MQRDHSKQCRLAGFGSDCSESVIFTRDASSEAGARAAEQWAANSNDNTQRSTNVYLARWDSAGVAWATCKGRTIWAVLLAHAD